MNDSHEPVKPKPLSGPQKALRKLGLVRPINLAMHLPLRYEDETRLIRLLDPLRLSWDNKSYFWW